MDAKERFQELLQVAYPAEFVDKAEQIPAFSPPTGEEKEKNKYDNEQASLRIDKYTGLYAFGHMLLGMGGAEGLYRTINSFLLSNFEKDKEYAILDAGCGVGRTLYDCAEIFPKAFFVGMDFSYKMCERAREVVIEGEAIQLTDSLALGGFKKEGGIEMERTKSLKNVFIAQGTVLSLPFKSESFDCVVNTYLIDRLEDPIKAIEEMIRVMKPGGLFILSDPLNFDKAEAREKVPDKEHLIEIIENCGVKIKEKFDGLVYREIMDSRGNYEDWMSFICWGNKLA